MNAESEWAYRAVNPSRNPYNSQNLRSFQQSPDLDNIVIQRNQQPEDHHDRPECNRGDIAPIESDYTAYYECVDGHYKLQLCPSNTFFNPTLKRCHADYVRSNRAKELPTTSPLSCKYGEFRADETSIGDQQYFERRFCPNGKVFDCQLNRCVSDVTRNKCQQSAQQSFESRNIAVGLACIESSGPSGYNADPTDYRRYYQCAQGRWIRMQCPSNLVWNSAATVCDWPKNTLLSCQ
ncbi:unnamed protein product [Onchocerca ochengi]|uniref:Chitin-binding type-2 domain-containing protein n=1 Tax=Onchocerca ochengi TaxID=42157 RepID=A0A182E092_ONCOC|nr:unnamed protein product [Onchocerca ochengi]